MRAGKLRHTVAIQAITESRNSFGEVVKTWATVTTRKAAIKPLAGNELTIAQQVHSEVTHELTMRYNTVVDSTKRLVFDSRTFEILSVLNVDERSHELVLMAKEVS